MEKRKRARSRFSRWCTLIDRQYVIPPHVKLLHDTLEKVERGEIKRLILNLPPRMSKSDTTSQKFPAWFLGRNPDTRVIVGCHSLGLAIGFSRTARALLREYGDTFSVTLSGESKAADEWNIEGRRGGFKAAGVGTGITGKGADLLVIDDPTKDAEAVFSETQRQAVWDWYTSTARTRLAPGGRIVVIQTRWHEDDLTGRLLEEDKKRRSTGKAPRWHQLIMPMIEGDTPASELEPEDLYERQLWKGRYSVEELQELLEVGSYWWNALFMQRPTSPEGQIFKRSWWRWWTRDPALANEDISVVRIPTPGDHSGLGDLHWMAQSWDCAFKDEVTSDYVVGQVWGGRGPDRYLIDQVRDRMDLGATINAIRAMSAKWPHARAKFVEDKANGPAVISRLTRELSGMVAVEPDGGKVVRARAAQPDVESRHVFLPYGAPWVQDFIDECADFPTGRNDDQVDAMTQLINRMVGKGAAILRARGMVNK